MINTPKNILSALDKFTAEQIEQMLGDFSTLKPLPIPQNFLSTTRFKAASSDYFTPKNIWEPMRITHDMLRG